MPTVDKTIETTWTEVSTGACTVFPRESGDYETVNASSLPAETVEGGVIRSGLAFDYGYSDNLYARSLKNGGLKVKVMS